MASHQQNTFMLSILISLLISYPTLSFKIIDCGNSKTTKINVTQNNKNVVEYNDPSSMISINGKDTVELWCETDCWFSKCILTHQPNNADGCESSEEPYESEKREVFSEFENSKRHICKFEIEKDFSCQDIGDWKMTIIEDGFAKRTRESTFVFEPINEPPVESRSKGKQPGKLAGLLLRNKYTDCLIKNLRLWSVFPSYNKSSFKPSEDSWQLLADSHSWRPINKATNQVYTATFINNLKQNRFKAYSRTIDDCYNPNCKSVSDYYGSDTTCSMFIWFQANDIKWSTCVMKSDEYKERKLGYKINTKPKEYPYLGIKECLEYDIDDDWCQDCNDESEIHQLNENEIEVSRNTDSTYNLTSMECMDSPVEVVDLVYGNKPQNDLKSESFCYTPQSYLNHRQCNNNVSDVTWCDPESEENDIRCSKSNLETHLFKGSCNEFSYARIKFTCRDGNSITTVIASITCILVVCLVVSLIGLKTIGMKRANSFPDIGTSESGTTLEKTSVFEGELHRAKDIDLFLNCDPAEPDRDEWEALQDLHQRKHLLRFSSKEASQHRYQNRYTNCIPFDYNRVQLQSPINGTDYINASYITGVNAEPIACRESRYMDTAFKLSNVHPVQSEWKPEKFSNINFIASQGPLPNTCVHHLQMIYELEIDFVIMLTKCEEGEKKVPKCAKYWPAESNKTKTFGHMEIEMIEHEIDIFPDTIKRTFQLRNNHLPEKMRKNIEFIQIHYVGWPDFGAPADPEPIISLVKEMRRMIAITKKSEKINVLVHCSAGVGRTGTLITLYKMMETLDSQLHNEDENGHIPDISIDIFNTVFEFRSKRTLMVQSPSQYKYLYASLSAYAKEILQVEEDGVYVDPSTM